MVEKLKLTIHPSRYLIQFATWSTSHEGSLTEIALAKDSCIRKRQRRFQDSRKARFNTRGTHQSHLLHWLGRRRGTSPILMMPALVSSFSTLRRPSGRLRDQDLSLIDALDQSERDLGDLDDHLPPNTGDHRLTFERPVQAAEAPWRKHHLQPLSRGQSRHRQPKKVGRDVWAYLRDSASSRQSPESFKLGGFNLVDALDEDEFR